MLGVVAQDTTLDLELTVRENLLVFARYFDIPRPEAARRADELLDLMALSDRADDEVDRLSRRHAPAPPDRPRAHQPARGWCCWTSPPPASTRRRATRCGSACARCAGDGATLVLTTHYMDEAAQLCDRLVIMDGGRIVRAGRPADLVAREVGREVLELRVAPGRRGRRCSRTSTAGRAATRSTATWCCCSRTTPRRCTPTPARPGCRCGFRRPGRRAGGRLPAPHRPTPTRLSSQQVILSSAAGAARARWPAPGVAHWSAAPVAVQISANAAAEARMPSRRQAVTPSPSHRRRARLRRGRASSSSSADQASRAHSGGRPKRLASQIPSP